MITLIQGQTKIEQVIVKDGAGNVLPPTDVVWESTNAGVFTQTPVGGYPNQTTIEGIGLGSAILRVSANGLHTQEDVQVTVGPPATIEIDPV